MILQALYRLALEEGLVEDPDFEVRPVAWLVDVGPAGELLGIRGTHTTVEVGKTGKTKSVAKPLRIPRRRTGKSGTKAPPDFFVENAKYAFGFCTADKQFTAAEGAEKAGWFQDDIRKCWEATRDPGVLAVLHLLEGVATRQTAIMLPDECKSNDLFCFVLAADIDVPVHEREAVREYWNRLRHERDAGTGRQVSCLVTGKEFAGAPLVRMVKGVPGASSSGGALVSFNKPAFESHGWENNQNAPISAGAGEAVAVALARLLDRDFRLASAPDSALPVRHLRLGPETAMAYWCNAGPGEELVNFLAGLLSVDDPERVKEAFRSIWRGQAVALSDPGRFFGLTVSGAQGRVLIRDWFELPVAALNGNLACHFADLAIVRNTPPPKGGNLPPALPLRALLGSLAPFGNTDGIPAPLVSAFVSAALRARPYPLSLLLRAMERSRAEIGRSEWADLERRDARAALIKGVLARHFNRKLTPDMDPTNAEPGYLLGRLMAVIERLQQAALGDVNASVVDRYFSSASATPRSVFTRLLRNARHHARKASDEPTTQATARWLENQIDEIAARFDPATNGFPAHLELEQQGLFVLGYHQQRHFLWMNTEAREAWAARWRTNNNQAA